MIPESAIQKLKSSLRGQTFSPGDPGYDEARTVPNAMIDPVPRSSPAALVLPMSSPVFASLANTTFSYRFEGVGSASQAKPFATVVF
jgi:hypothetical protein